MNEVTLRKLLEDVRAGRVPSETALKRLKSLSIHDLDFAARGRTSLAPQRFP